MQHLKIIFSLSVIFILTILNSDAQINQDKTVKTWNSNGLNASPAAKVPANVDLGQNQRTETIAKMEKQEKEVNELAILGDGRISKIEEVILNQIRTLKESIK
jgi:hypothetical protein